MTHKEKMNWLKKNDPITYYEMNSNPTGSDTSSVIFSAIIIVFISVILAISVVLIS